MTELVSPCCGSVYNDDEIPISNCCGTEQEGDSDICPDKDCLEHADFFKYKCNHCDEWFEEPEKDYEYEERIKESIAEDKMDGDKDETLGMRI